MNWTVGEYLLPLNCCHKANIKLSVWNCSSSLSLLLHSWFILTESNSGGFFPCFAWGLRVCTFAKEFTAFPCSQRWGKQWDKRKNIVQDWIEIKHGNRASNRNAQFLEATHIFSLEIGVWCAERLGSLSFIKDRKWRFRWWQDRHCLIHASRAPKRIDFSQEPVETTNL